MSNFWEFTPDLARANESLTVNSENNPWYDRYSVERTASIIIMIRYPYQHHTIIIINMVYIL